MNDHDAPNACRRIGDDLKAFCDGELSVWRQNAVRRHLARCASCRAEVQTMQQLRQDLRDGAGTDAQLPPALRARILTQLEDAAEHAPPRAAPPPRPWLLRHGLAASLAVNATLVVGLVYTGVLMTHRGDPVVPTVSAPAGPPVRSQAPRSAGAGSGGGPKAKSSAHRRVSLKPAQAPGRPAGAPAADRSVSVGASANSLRPAPPAAPRRAAPASVPPLYAVPLTPPVTISDSPAGVRRQDQAGAGAARARVKTSPSRVASDAAPAPAEAPGAPPPANGPNAFADANGTATGSGFGGGAFGGGGFGGSATPRQETAADGALAPPPAPAAPKPAPGQTGADQERQAPAIANGALAAKTAPPADRDAPALIGAWPTVTLPPGVDLTVKAVAVTWDVDEQGRVFHVRFKTTNSPEADGAIRAAVHAGRYAPATRRNQPIKGQLTHTFSLAPTP